jgi:tripeptidyl-peptidase-1
MPNLYQSSSSHHASPNYGKHYTADEIVDLFKPSESSVDSVTLWLSDAGISSDRISQSANKQWIQFDSTIPELEDILQTEYHVFEHEKSGLQDVACEK